jgi:hypothetical protein
MYRAFKKGDPKSQKKMVKYCENDVKKTEREVPVRKGLLQAIPGAQRNSRPSRSLSYLRPSWPIR